MLVKKCLARLKNVCSNPWAHMDPCGPIWAHMSPRVPIWTHLGPYGFIFAPCGHICVHMGANGMPGALRPDMFQTAVVSGTWTPSPVNT
jgi:hypothetical protein